MHDQNIGKHQVRVIKVPALFGVKVPILVNRCDVTFMADTFYNMYGTSNITLVRECSCKKYFMNFNILNSKLNLRYNPFKKVSYEKRS